MVQESTPVEFDLLARIAIGLTLHQPFHEEFAIIRATYQVATLKTHEIGERRIL